MTATELNDARKLLVGETPITNANLATFYMADGTRVIACNPEVCMGFERENARLLAENEALKRAARDMSIL